MQGFLSSLAEGAGRHVLQLWTLLRECMLARIALFTAVCAIAVFSLTTFDGLGPPSQAITALSAGTSAHDGASAKGGFQEIKGLKETRDFPGLHDPFGEIPGTEGRKRELEVPQKNKEKPLVKGADSPGKAPKAPAAKQPKVQGLLQGREDRAALVEYDGQQHVLYSGDRLGDLLVETVEDNQVILVTPQGRQAINVGP